MSRNNTGNPIDSKAFPDFEDNVKNLDQAVNSEELSWRDRFGRDRKSFEGMEREFDSAQHSREARFNDFISASGYQFLGDYGPGIEFTEYNQLVRDENGEFWRASGQVDLPYVTTGDGIPEGDALVPAGDAVLRQDLADTDKGAAMVARGVVAVDSIADLLALPEGQRKEGLRYLVKGYHAGSNLGGGEFCWDAGLIGENDGGIVFNGFLRISQDVTFEDFGATSGGYESLVDIIQSAVDACAARGLRSIYGGVGPYNLTGQSVAVPSGVSIRLGNDTLLVCDSPRDHPFFMWEGSWGAALPLSEDAAEGASSLKVPGHNASAGDVVYISDSEFGDASPMGVGEVDGIKRFMSTVRSVAGDTLHLDDPLPSTFRATYGAICRRVTPSVGEVSGGHAIGAPMAWFHLTRGARYRNVRAEGWMLSGAISIVRSIDFSGDGSQTDYPANVAPSNGRGVAIHASYRSELKNIRGTGCRHTCLLSHSSSGIFIDGVLGIRSTVDTLNTHGRNVTDVLAVNVVCRDSEHDSVNVGNEIAPDRRVSVEAYSVNCGRSAFRTAPGTDGCSITGEAVGSSVSNTTTTATGAYIQGRDHYIDILLQSCRQTGLRISGASNISGRLVVRDHASTSDARPAVNIIASSAGGDVSGIDLDIRASNVPFSPAVTLNGQSGYIDGVSLKMASRACGSHAVRALGDVSGLSVDLQSTGSSGVEVNFGGGTEGSIARIMSLGRLSGSAYSDSGINNKFDVLE